jgi:hypothetical protein
MTQKPPIALVNADKPDEVIAHACGKCGVVAGSVREHGERSEEVARFHCGPWTCEKCGAEHDRSYQPVCSKCFHENLSRRRAEQEENAFKKATKVPASEHDGPVYWEGAGCSEGFFSSLDDLLDMCADQEIEPPKYVWPCIVIHPQLRFEDLQEQALDDHSEGCELDAEDELREFLDQWNAKQTGESWEPIYYKVLMLEE